MHCILPKHISLFYYLMPVYCRVSYIMNKVYIFFLNTAHLPQQNKHIWITGFLPPACLPHCYTETSGCLMKKQEILIILVQFPIYLPWSSPRLTTKLGGAGTNYTHLFWQQITQESVSSEKSPTVATGPRRSNTLAGLVSLSGNFMST